MSELFPLSKLPLPIRPHAATAHRWAMHGVRGVRLPTIIIGGRRFVSRDGLDQFLRALNATPAPATEPAAAAAADRAGRDLEALGA